METRDFDLRAVCDEDGPDIDIDPVESSFITALFLINLAL